MKRTLLASLALAVLTLTGVGAAQPTTATAATCDGVWVVVDYGSIGGVSTACATSYSTGVEALRSAGFNPILADGMLTRISDKPASVDLNKSYWSYWQSALKADGSHAAWKYSTLGATATHPTRGSAEGWHFVSLSEAASGPGAAPPDSPVVKPSPTPTPTSAKPKPSATPSKSATPAKSPSASTSASASASAGTPSSAPSASPTSTLTAWPTPSANPSGPTVMATPYVAQTTTPVPTDAGGGGPVGLIVAAVVVVAGGGGLGLWWYLRGRKR